MAQSFASHGTPTLAASDLLISIHPRACTRYHGTAAQLIAEGLIPDGLKWPHRASRVSFEMGKFTYHMGRCRPDGFKGPMSAWAEGDYWLLQRSLTAEEGHGLHHAQLYEKKMELANLIRRNTAEWMHTFNRAWETRKDDKYQAFRLQLLGEPKRGRGRPAKASIATPSQPTTIKGENV